MRRRGRRVKAAPWAAAAQERYYSYESYDYVGRAAPIIREGMLPEYAFYAGVVGGVVALGSLAWRATRATPPTRREKGWVTALKSLRAGAAAFGLGLGGFLTMDVANSAAESWVKGLVAAAWVGVGVGAGYLVNSLRKNRVWTGSKAYQEMLQAEEARVAGDVEALDRLGQQARSRRQRMKLLIEQAEQSGSETVNTEHGKVVPLAEARRFAAFDLLVAGRAELNENAISTNPESRIGGDTPATWKDRLSRDEAEAKASGFEGKLALRLKKLSLELVNQGGAAAGIAKGFEEFSGFIPKLFGGQMSQELKRAEGDLKEYHADEMGAEQSLYDEVNRAMRKRVSDRLYGEREDFKQHRDRLDRLAALQDGPVKAAVDEADYIDDKLGSAISNLQNQQTYLALAAANTAVPETYTDSKGNVHTRIVDKSGPYRAMAAAAAMSAASDASSARDGLKRMAGHIVTLHNDPTMALEKLQRMIPRGQDSDVDAGSGMWTAWFLPPLFGMFSAMGSISSISSTRAEFGAVRGALQSLDGEVGSRRAVEQKWVDAVIDEDLRQQMARVAP